MIGSQTSLPGDPKFVEFSELWQKEMFKKLEGKGKL